jgi:Cytochrome c554 and c-prime
MYKKILLVVCLVAIALCLGSKVYADEHKYIGAKKCKMCHMSEAKGNQYKVWSESAHAKAYENLATDAAKKTAEKVGLKTDPQKSPECLKCHVTTFGVKDDLKEESVNIADGVECESCHGGGGDYKALSVMKDKTQAVAAGLIIPTKEVCIKCHNTESPNYKEFKYDEFYKKIAHPMPAK